MELRPESGEFDPDEIPIQFQSLSQLSVYCKRNNLNVPIEEYTDTEIARQHVELAMASPDAFQRIYEKYSERLNEEKELASLNQDFEGIGEQGSQIDIDSATGKANAKPNEQEMFT